MREPRGIFQFTDSYGQGMRMEKRDLTLGSLLCNILHTYLFLQCLTLPKHR